MYKKKTVFFASIVALAVLAVLPFSGVLGDTNPSVAYLKGKPLSPWSIMALFAAGESPSLDSLRTVAGSKAIDLEAPILALAAAGENPRAFAGNDLIARLKNFYDGEQLGEAEILNDDIFGLLALVAGSEETSDPVVSGIQNFILANQNADGGFSFAIGGESETNTTAAAIMALRAAGVPSADGALVSALAYLRGAQNEDGGFPYDPGSSWGTDSDSSSDAWVVMALRSAGESPENWVQNGNTPVAHLEGLRQGNGSYLYQPGGSEDSFTPITTSYALLALSGHTLPVISDKAPAPAPQGTVFSFRIEGGAETLCTGEGWGESALDAVLIAKEMCGVSYHIEHSALGDYVDEIAGERASGVSGWMYTVNAETPSVGASAYTLASGDAVVWYFGTFGEAPAITSVPLSVTVPERSNGENGHGGDDEDSDEGGDAPSVTLVIDIAAGGSAEALRFGELSRGGVSEKTVSLENNGGVAVSLSTSIAGDALFRRYLRVGEKGWRDYRVLLSSRTSTTTTISLSVPSDYSASGEKQGTLIFWATPVAE